MIPRHLFFAILLAVAAPGASAGPEELRAEFRAILFAPGMPHADSAELRSYVLFPYVEAARLRAALAAAPAANRDPALEKNLQAFLLAHAGEPVTQPLLRDWLNFLAARKAWTEFLSQMPADAADIGLRCHAVNARLELKHFDGQRDAALALWRQHRDVPPACAPVFEWLEGPGRLTDAEVETRAIFAAQLRLKLPKIVARLPAPRRALLQLWDRLMNDPVRELDRFLKAPEQVAQWPTPDVAAALLEAFARASRRSARQSQALLPGLALLTVFDESQRVELRRLQAMGFAYDFDVEALGAFGALPENVLDTLGREWRVRAALLHEAWASADRWIAAMPDAQRNEPRWKYWRARVLAQQGREAEARAIYEEVAKAREYYAFLAAERLGRTPDLRPVAFKDDKKLQATIEARPAMARAKELFLGDFADLAALEMRVALRDDDAPTRLQAAKLIWTWGWYVQALKAFAEQLQWDDLAMRFPLPYDSEVDAAARVSGLPGSWIYTVLRTESLYDPRAVSSANACGLLQIKLDTARQVARRASLARPSRDDLFSPSVNIVLGARYLAEMQERFGGQFIFTLAAYNAGPDKAREWLPRRPVPADVWVENIPFNETRGYVQRALSSLVMIEWRRTGRAGALLPLLPTIGGDRQDAAQ